MSVIADLKTVLKNRIGALNSVGVVYGYEEAHPKQWPAVIVTPANLEGEFVSTTENRRIFGCNVSILFPTGQNVPKDLDEKPIEYAERVIGQVLDDIIDDVDKNSFLSDFADISDSDSDFLFLSAADAEWGWFNFEGGKARAIQIVLLAHIDFTARTS